ncbi:MaoC family dehydratase N-terminal domain-containing protein [Cupriavidus alkaliphilus]|uniref:MaoC family dehydratase N-terminal domain-containing protein n=1 Tax=Cupriavidus alkaliphilus TaxID=942866 RepID=UPI0016212EB2|nr:MaoC family dehydratase N-terminal domain-containing protein [Cupriavidus alkaliphilus]MBB2919988.1 acyl dehydratase [Cupriavidus alkaliphilus]MBB3013274.1 acyl dehydratase [Cupriavidus alkaliphilus]
MIVLNTGLFWDDLAAGTRFRSRSRTITEADLVSFVNLSWLNEELFTNAGDRSDMAIPGRVVPAALLYACAEGLVTPSMQGTGLAFLNASLDVSAPTFVGDTIRVECEVVEHRATSRPGRGLVRTRNAVVNQHGQTVLTYSPLRLMRMKHAVPAQGSRHE